VSVASHDGALAGEALRRLQSAGTRCDLELLYGLPMRASLRVARRLGVPVRVYIPYGAAYLPYAVSRLRKSPRIAWWLLRDLVASFAVES
jgi:proline dehydrogenase